jgi:uncharacterized protein (TIGR00251 family)
MTAIQPTGSGCRIRVRVQPRASRTEIAGPHGDAIRIRVAAPPVDGAANRELIRFLADRLGIPPRRVSLVRGDATRDKVLEVRDLAAEAVRTRLFPEGPLT